MSVYYQVGTLDVLVGLSDELGKLDPFVERYLTSLLLIAFAHYMITLQTCECDWLKLRVQSTSS